MYIHITNERIKTLVNEPSREQIRTAIKTDKPAGLWYAYNDEWKDHFYKVEKDLWKYTLNIKEDNFTDNYTIPAPTKILRLNRDNFAKVIATYGKDYVYSNRNILENLIYARERDGDETLDFLLGMNENESEEYNKSKGKNIEELIEILEDLIDGGIDIDDIESDKIDLLIEKIKEHNNDDELPYKQFNWGKFWKNLSDKFAGVDFAEDLLDKKEINNPIDSKSTISTDFLKLVGIRSGVIFKPLTFFAGRKFWTEEEIRKNSGGALKKTRKHKSRYRRKSKKHRTHKK
jgi:hypothetical protein